MTDWKVEAPFRSMSAVRFAQEFLDLFDSARLKEVKVRTSGSQSIGIHGNCKPPGYPKLTARNHSFRISCSVAETAFSRSWPRPRHSLAHGTHAGVARVETVAESVNELLAFVLGHELYHFLGHKTREVPDFWQIMVPYDLTDGTDQIPGKSNSERRADQMGYEFLYAIREGRDPVEVAVALVDNEGLLAPQRFPYVRKGR